MSVHLTKSNMTYKKKKKKKKKKKTKKLVIKKKKTPNTLCIFRCSHSGQQWPVDGPSANVYNHPTYKVNNHPTLCRLCRLYIPLVHTLYFSLLPANDRMIVFSWTVHRRIIIYLQFIINWWWEPYFFCRAIFNVCNMERINGKASVQIYQLYAGHVISRKGCCGVGCSLNNGMMWVRGM